MIDVFISWLAGKAGDKALSYIIEHKQFQRDINQAIKNWAKSLPESKYVKPEVLFVEISGQNVEGERLKYYALLEKLKKPGLPEKEEWYEAFIENWRAVKKLYEDEKGEPQPFFVQEETEASGWLERLAEETYKVCKLNEGIFRSHVVDKLDEIGEDVKSLVDGKLRPVKEVENKISLSKLPVTSNKLFGREEEIEGLEGAWGDGETHVYSLVAWGGVGKTALVNEWLGRMGLEDYRGAVRVYGWSFYSQGTREDRQASSDGFLAEALKWFGDEEDTKQKSPWDKGVRVAELVRREKTLLILDGVEPLQYPPGPMQGKLKDQGIQALLRELASYNPGLCVVTTRERIEDIENKKGAKRIDLETLSDDAGAEVLRENGVKGTEKELKETSKEFGGHALALNLLGSYLATVHGGEIRKRDMVPKLTDDERQGGHARRVMESYEIWLKGKPELDILYLMGLFDRPAEGGAIDVLRRGEVIKGLTERLEGLAQAKWKFAVRHLRELRLLAEEEKGMPEMLDCHPLIREHFGEKLKEGNLEGWKEAHGRLYEYYRDKPEKEEPDTLEEMEPLFAAVAHGCAAGRGQETLVEVYWKRIKRGKEHYSTKKLGAFGSDLGAVGCFFERCWDRPMGGLREEDKAAAAAVLSWAGFRLRSVGRLREAAEPIKTGMEKQIKLEDWKNAARSASNLSELWLTLGEVARAVEYGKRSVEYADSSGDDFQRESKRTAWADALHQAGEVEKAEGLFMEAEGMQRKSQPEYEYLYSLPVYRFCDLLMVQGKYQEVIKRAVKTLKWVTKAKWLLDIGLDNLSLGRAYMMEAVTEGTGDWGKSEEYLDRAVAGLREAGMQDYLPLGLLARAELFRVKGEYEKAEAELGEAREIAERGEMKLHLADCSLEEYRILKARGREAEAEQELKKAREMIEEMGYYRRRMKDEG